jgi:hypothetical protein
MECLQTICTAEEGRAKMRAYPVDWAFADVLERIHTGSYALMSLTDTADGAGDGHKGPFATRNFAKWLIRNGLMAGTSISGIRPINHDESDYNITGWMLIPNPESIDEFLAHKIAEIQKYIEDSNDDPALEAQEEAKAAAQTETRAAIESGWEGFPIPETGGGEPPEQSYELDEVGGVDRPRNDNITSAELHRAQERLRGLRRSEVFTRAVPAALTRAADPVPLEAANTAVNWRVIDDALAAPVDAGPDWEPDDDDLEHIATEGEYDGEG